MAAIPCRREFIQMSGAGAAIALLLPGLDAQTPPTTGAARKPAPRPAALSAAMVEETVGKSHSSLADVRRLVAETPLLANACWDWGGGDFETALEAAAHTGQREIAEFLLSRGARPSLYAAAMLGQLDLVKAFHVIDPQAHAIVGPHGFTVVHCAQRGGAAAKSVVEWLLANGASPETNVGLKYVRPAG